MFLWVDDIRKPPSDKYIWVKSVNMAKMLIKDLSKQDEQIVIDLDHDAGDYANQGGDYIKILDWMEEQGIDDIAIHLHTMNVVGKMNMEAICRRNNWTMI